MRSQQPLVLTIDDDPSITRVLQVKLEKAGYRVQSALTAEEGLERIRELSPDAVITDVKMPGMGGIELCRRCEELQRARPFLIIVLTSQIDRESLDWIETREDRLHVSKPFSPRDILRIIDAYFGKATQNTTEAAAVDHTGEPT